MAFNKAKAMQEAEKSVSQGKTAQAIKQYLLVFEKDPADLALLNTVGDLYVREKNMPEALKYFHKLADSYTQEGFTVKAIAIYKKISKLDPSTVDVLLKMAELYTVQGLGREAREQYSQAVEYYKKKNQNDKALDVYRKIVALDPENTTYRVRLADFLESQGKKADAGKIYIETVEVALRKGDDATIELAMKKALTLEPKNPQLQFLRARIAFGKNQPGEVEKIIQGTPELASNPAARQLLLEAYIAGHKLDAAEKLLVDVFRANPTDFTSMAAYCEQCLATNEIDAAFKPLSAVADLMLENKNTGPLMEVLRKIWAKTPGHIPTLELISKVAEKTADEFTLPEVLDALGNAYVKAGALEKAEKIYRQLVAREPENETLKGLLKQVLQKQGKEPEAAKPEDLSNVEMALTPEAEAAPTAEQAAAAAKEAEAAAVVKEALDNCDLFNRYGLMDKAFAELDKALSASTDNIDVYKRMLEIAQKSDRARATLAARALARIYAEHGDHDTSKKYEHMASSPDAHMMVEEIPRPTEPPPPKSEPAPPVATEFDLSEEFLGQATVTTPHPSPDATLGLGAPPAPVTPPPSTEVPIDLTPAPVEEAPRPPVQEIDLTGGLAPPPTAEAPGEEAPVLEAQPVEVPPFNYEDSKVEIDYYLDQGFRDEARAAVQALEEKFPGNAQVAELRDRVEGRLAPPAKVEEVPPPEMAPTPPLAETLPPVAAKPPVLVPEPSKVEVPPPVVEPPPLPAPPAAPPAAPPGSDTLGGLIGDLEASLDGISTDMPPAAKGVESGPAKSGASASPASPLSGFLDELGEGEQAAAAQDDPQTHYDLGVAFREMNLLDEAIGEFQKVVKGAQKGVFPPNFLQVCTLLALCFMDKQMPAIAVKWYLRALEMPDLDEEATMAVHYDLGVAYEQSGDIRKALEKYSEVYSQNIDYRDVAEKIRQLQSKS